MKRFFVPLLLLLFIAKTYPHEHGLVPNQPIYNCFEKDLEPVDTDEEFPDYCKDYAGNIHFEYANVTSCCECIRYECVPLGELNEQKYFYWNKSISEHCCLHCDGTVYKADTVIETVFEKDECRTIKTSVCRKNDGGMAEIEIDFTYKHCCNDEEGILPTDTVKLEPSTCSERTCKYSVSSTHSSWISTQVLSGCKCCVVDGILVPDGFSWIVEDEEFECCEGKIVTVYEGSGSGSEILSIEDSLTPDCYTESLDCRSSNNMLNWTIIYIRDYQNPEQEFFECKTFCDKVDGCEFWTLTAWKYSVNFWKCYALSSCSNIYNISILASGPRICYMSDSGSGSEILSFEDAFTITNDLNQAIDVEVTFDFENKVTFSLGAAQSTPLSQKPTNVLFLAGLNENGCDRNIGPTITQCTIIAVTQEGCVVKCS